MKRKCSITLIILVAISLLGSNVTQIQAQLAQSRGIIAANQDFIAVGTDQGVLRLFDEEGTQIKEKTVVERKVGHLLIDFRKLAWLNDSTLFFQTGPSHIGFFNINTDFLIELEPEVEEIKSLTYDPERNSLLYVVGNETIKWRSVSNQSETIKIQAKQFLFNFGIIDFDHAKVRYVHTIKDSIFFQYNNLLYRYNLTTDKLIAKFKGELSNTALIEINEDNEQINIAEGEIVKSLDYDLSENYRWYFEDREITSMDMWKNELLVGFSNGDIRKIKRGDAHGEILDTGASRIDDLEVVDDKVIYLTYSRGDPTIKNIGEFEKEWLSPVIFVNEFFWRNGIDRIFGWGFVIVILTGLTLFFIPKLYRRSKGPVKCGMRKLREINARSEGFTSLDDREQARKKGFKIII